MEGFQGFASPIDPYLDPGEKLLWSGQPQRGIRLQWNDLIMIPFSMVWCGFAIFWEMAVLGLVPTNSHQTLHHPPLFMAIFGLPFVAIGLYMVVGRFFSDAAGRKRTWYAVTDKRLIILKTFMGTKVISYDYANLQNLNLVERGDRSGDIVFGMPFPMMAGSDIRVRRSTGLPGFYQVADAREVFSRIDPGRAKAGEDVSGSPRTIILASGSPRRRELLAQMGVKFEVVTAEVRELTEGGGLGLALHNASTKALAVAKLRPGRWVLGADTVVAIDGRVLGKPASQEQAAEFLRRLSGRTHEVITGCALRDPDAGRIAATETFYARTRVTFRALSGETIARYLAAVHVLDKAGAYALQEHGDWIVERLEGSRTNVIGLPTELLARVFRRRGLL